MLGATRLVHWLCQLLLLSPALNLRLPRVPAPPVRLAAATSRTRSLVLLAKKKQKGKAPKEAAAALAALDAWDATQAPGLVGEVDDPLAPVQAVTKKPFVKKKDLDAPPLVAPLPVEGGAAAAPMTTEASPPPPAAPAVTMAGFNAAATAGAPITVSGFNFGFEDTTPNGHCTPILCSTPDCFVRSMYLSR